MTERQCRAALVVLFVFLAGGLGSIARSQPERPEVTTLVARSSSAKDGFAARALVGAKGSEDVVAWRGSEFATLRESNGALNEQRTGTDLQEINGPHAIALDRRGRTIAATKAAAHFLDANGRAIRSFPIQFSESIVSLPNGDFAVSSPTVDGLIHVYSWLGAQRAHLGRLKDSTPTYRRTYFSIGGLCSRGRATPMSMSSRIRLGPPSSISGVTAV